MAPAHAEEIDVAATTEESIRTVRNGRLISLEVDQASIHSVLRIIAEVLSLNIVLHKNVEGSVSAIRLRDVPAEQVLDIVLRMNGLYATREGNVVIVYRVSDYLESSSLYKDKSTEAATSIILPNNP